MTKTESVEALLNPSLRVSRPVAACARCRGAKIKCDGKLPACSACERAGKGKECSSANDDFAKGKERSYVAALETAIQRLQKQAKELHASNEADQHYLMTGDTMNGRPLVRRRVVSGSKRKEASDVDELVSDFGFLTVNATSRDFHGFTSTMSFARLLLATAIKKPLPLLGEYQMPSRYLITPLVDHYFNNIYVLLPFFSETTFRGSLNRIYQDSSPSTTVAAIDHWYVRLVLAISAASTCASKSDGKYDAAMQHVCAAMKYAEYVIHPGSVAGIQALLLLVQYAMVDPEHFDSWYLIGMASRLVVDLGLHCEPNPETKLSKHTLDLRRRVFYCTFALDRQISMAYGYAFSFTDDSAPNVLLPTLATDMEKRSPTQLFLPSTRPSLFLFDIRRVQSGFYQATHFSTRKGWIPAFAKEYVSSFLNDVRAWHDSIPSSFDQRHLQLFYVEFLYSQILAVSPNQNVPLSNIPDTQRVYIFQFATQFADQMQLMVQRPESQAFLTYTDICRAKLVGRHFQEVIWASFDMLLRNQHTIAAPAQPSTITPVDNCSRAISFVNKTTMILDFARARWGLGELREEFEQETAVLLSRLQSKQQEFHHEAAAMAPPYPPNTQSFSGLPVHSATDSGYEPANFAHTQSPTQTMGALYNDVGSAMHRSNLIQSSWTGNSQTNLDLPQASLPRRSYEFMGNNSN